MITKEDVLSVAKDLKFLPTEEEIQQVIDGFESEANSDPSGCIPTWIENLLYSFDIKQMETIKFNGKKYPTRTFEVNLDGDDEVITISTESLEDDLDIENDMTAMNIDSCIYFYVADELINLSAEEICKSHLDEPMIFIEEK